MRQPAENPHSPEKEAALQRGRPARGTAPPPNPSRALPCMIASVLLALAALALLGLRAEAQTAEAPSAASLYAESQGVTEAQAAAALELQWSAGRLEEDLARSHPGTFAGLYLEGSGAPEDLSVVARFVGQAPDDARRAMDDLAAQAGASARLTGAESSLEDLRQAQKETAAAAARSDTPADTAVDVRENDLEVSLEEPPPPVGPLAGALHNPEVPVSVEEGSRAIEPALAGGATLKTRGGRTCTAGFAVSRPGGSAGITTAAHCPQKLFLGKRNRLPFRDQQLSGSSDLQWHSTGRTRPSPAVHDGRGRRTITGTVGRDAQPVGAFVCKYGSRTGRTCGRISGKWYAPAYVPRANATFIGISSRKPVVLPGDSGGPVFSGSYALGTATAYSRQGSTHYGYYMAVDYLAELGLSVRTSR